MFDIIDNKIYLSRGDSAVIGIEITDDEGETYTPGVGEMVLFTLKRVTNQCKTLLVKEFIEDSSDLSVTLTQEDTIDLSFGDYVYDVVLVSDEGDVYTIIAPSEFKIMEVVHNEITSNS